MLIPDICEQVFMIEGRSVERFICWLIKNTDVQLITSVRYQLCLQLRRDIL